MPKSDATRCSDAAWRGLAVYEALPPGLLLMPMEADGIVTSGNLTFTAEPDVMMMEQSASEARVREGRLAASCGDSRRRPGFVIQGGPTAAGGRGMGCHQAKISAAL
jgi:hypothetical protein